MFVNLPINYFVSNYTSWLHEKWGEILRWGDMNLVKTKLKQVESFIIDIWEYVWNISLKTWLYCFILKRRRRIMKREKRARHLAEEKSNAEDCSDAGVGATPSTTPRSGISAKGSINASGSINKNAFLLELHRQWRACDCSN